MDAAFPTRSLSQKEPVYHQPEPSRHYQKVVMSTPPSVTMAHPSYTMRDTAYLIMTMHAGKYYSTITGLLLGTASETEVTINDVLPLVHSDLVQGTTSVTETALLLAEQRAKETSQILVGLYFANENPTDTSIPLMPTRVADRLLSRFPNTIMLHIDAARLLPDVRMQRHCARIRVKQEASGPWSRVTLPDDALVVSERALCIAHRLMAESLAEHVAVSHVIDFEDHCLDPREDWLNLQLSARLNALPPPS